MGNPVEVFTGPLCMALLLTDGFCPMQTPWSRPYSWTHCLQSTFRHVYPHRCLHVFKFNPQLHRARSFSQSFLAIHVAVFWTFFQVRRLQLATPSILCMGTESSLLTLSMAMICWMTKFLSQSSDWQPHASSERLWQHHFAASIAELPFALVVLLQFVHQLSLMDCPPTPSNNSWQCRTVLLFIIGLESFSH